MADRIHALGTLFQRQATTSPFAYATIAGVSNLGGPGLALDAQDASAHDSPDGFREFVGGFRDGGEVTLELRFDPADTGHIDLRTDLEDARLGSYRIDWSPTGAGGDNVATFDALVTGWEPTENAEDVLVVSVSLKVSGKPAWSTAA